MSGGPYLAQKRWLVLGPKGLASFDTREEALRQTAAGRRVLRDERRARRLRLHVHHPALTRRPAMRPVIARRPETFRQ